MQRGSGAGRGVDEDEGDPRVAEVVSLEFAAVPAERQAVLVDYEHLVHAVDLTFAAYVSVNV